MKHENDEQHAIDTIEKSAQLMVDWNAMMKVCGGQDIAYGVVEIILRDTPQMLEAIADAIENDKPAKVRLNAHTLKGSAWNIGAFGFSDAARRLEFAAETEEKHLFVLLFEELKCEYDKLKTFLSDENWFNIAKQQTL